MLHIHRDLPAAFPKARMLLQIHDELVFEAPAGDMAPLAAFVVDRMQGAMSLRVPLEVSSWHGPTWAEA
jgi:DNA polymerase-1